MQSGQVHINSKKGGCRRSDGPCPQSAGLTKAYDALHGASSVSCCCQAHCRHSGCSQPCTCISHGRGNAMLTCTSCAPGDCFPARRRRAPRNRDLCSDWPPRCCSSGLCECKTLPPAALPDCDSCDCMAGPAAALEGCDSVPAAVWLSSTACAAAWVLGSGRALWSAASEATFLVALHSVHVQALHSVHIREQGPNWQDQHALCWSLSGLH
jgi:hypothetical protein